MLKKVLILGVVNLFLGLGLNMVLNVVFPQLSSEYQGSGLFRPWSDPLMSLYFAYPFIAGAVFIYLWGILGKSLKGDAWRRGFNFAKVYFLLATVPGMFITYTSMKVSILMIATWMVIGFLEAYIGGWLLANWDKKRA